jgi:hypothetical protein
VRTPARRAASTASVAEPFLPSLPPLPPLPGVIRVAIPSCLISKTLLASTSSDTKYPIARALEPAQALILPSSASSTALGPRWTPTPSSTRPTRCNLLPTCRFRPPRPIQAARASQCCLVAAMNDATAAAALSPTGPGASSALPAVRPCAEITKLRVRALPSPG